MIVYFLKKSKKHYKKWGIRAIIYILISYMMYIGIQIKFYDQRTVQIIRKNEQDKEVNFDKTNSFNNREQISDFLFVASKRGKYYYPIKCNKAQGLSPKNMLYFKDKTSAEDAGYKMISGC